MLCSLQVGSVQFLPLLNKTDEAITQLSSNSHFTDTNNYLNRFKSVQSRALTLVRQHLTTTLQAATERVQTHMKESAEGAGGRHESSLAVYVQYQAVAEPIKELMGNIAKRAAWSTDYEQLLRECQQTYFRQRQQLLQESVDSKLMAAVAAANLRETIRQGCAELCDLCHREYKLYQHFFPPFEGGDGLGILLEPFCTKLVDSVRPLYLKTADMHDLCSLVIICEFVQSLQGT